MYQGKKQVVVIAGPSGSGETTFTNELISAYPNAIGRPISATTRPPRSGEQDGRDYYFFSKERFFEEVQQGNIVEYTRVKDRDVFYGTYKPEIEKKLVEFPVVIVNTDLAGARYFKQHYGATTIFIKPKSIDILGARIERRNPDMEPSEVYKRLHDALAEIVAAEKQYDYTVFNTDGEFAETIAEVVAILQREGYRFE